MRLSEVMKEVRLVDNPFANDLQYLDAWKLRNDDGFTWFFDAWGLVG